MNDQILQLAEQHLRATPHIFNSLNAQQQAAFTARVRWLARAGDHQIPPGGDWWSIWLLLAGRGAGKTMCAAEWTWDQAWTYPNTRWLVGAPTSSDVEDVCFEGPSGILACCPHELIKKYIKKELTLVNGSIIKGIAASEPERFRGPQFHGGWLDELAAWDYLDDAWDMIQFGMRLVLPPAANGTVPPPRLVCTTTPKPKPLIVDLVNRDGKDVAVEVASTYDNLHNLAPKFRDSILQYEGTKIGRQEIHAEIIDPEESGTIKRSMFKLWSAYSDIERKHKREFPQFIFVLQSYDCATSEDTVNDPTACVVFGVFRPGPDLPMSAMVIDAWDEYVKYPDLRKRVTEDYKVVYGDPDEFGNGKKVDVVLVENKSAGISLIQDLQRAELPARAYNPGRADKMQRLNIVAPVVEKGRVYLPESDAPTRVGKFRSWCDAMLAQLCAFPEVRHDDYVDAFSQGLRYLRDAGWINIDPVAVNDDYADDVPRRRENPYAA